VKVVFLRDAEEDLKELRRYIVPKFGKETWLETKRRIKATIQSLAAFPQSGHIPDELAELGMTQYRQTLSGMNRLVYETRGGLLYVHIVCDTRRDLRDLLARRLLRAEPGKY
jgi:plasmid stabilization system protein ParE